MKINESIRKIISFREANWNTLSLEISDEEKAIFNSLNPYQCFLELQSIFLKTVGEDYASGKLRSFAYRCILILNEEIKLNFLLSLLYHTDDVWRSVACEALIEIPNPTSVLALANKLVTDEHGGVRYAAAEALEEIGDETALPFLEYARDHDEGEDWATFKVNKMAAQAIQAILERDKLGNSSS
jgi:HEAT repeats